MVVAEAVGVEVVAIVDHSLVLVAVFAGVEVDTVDIASAVVETLLVVNVGVMTVVEAVDLGVLVAGVVTGVAVGGGAVIIEVVTDTEALIEDFLQG